MQNSSKIIYPGLTTTQIKTAFSKLNSNKFEEMQSNNQWYGIVVIKTNS